jgi:hypothetical protein
VTERRLRTWQPFGLDASSSSSATTRDLTLYLRRTGWRPDDPGPAGALWRHDGAGTIAVPHDVTPRMPEWRGVLERIAVVERRRPEEVELSVERELTDVTHLRAANDLVIRGSIPLQAGISLVSSAWSMLRASATTSQRLNGHIARSYSRVGDELVEQVRLGHTEEGSYVIPILMPLPEPALSSPERPTVPGLEPERTPGEPPERRVMRTFAEALGAVERVVVSPERAPTTSELSNFVIAGGSRELLTAVHRVLADESVGELNAVFSWAGSVAAPNGVPRTVTLPSEAAPRLDEAARKLKVSKVSMGEVLSGLIVEVRHDPDELFGEIAIQTVRQGRAQEVRVRLRAETILRAHDWARDRRTVVCEGHVRQSPGRRAIIDEPRRIEPLDETLLPSLTS